ncbi:HNH endonuclease signature motif containing protein [Rosenbergiella epipactidis]|uniref:HNH endonuclease signature motif containing protein n=1 Tax=Rosenbergiella epipactidis TaxID=1544694 RepID=UPI001F4ECD22|nr:HNH endonuclease signature motif containing protein [Rosenbergiella epipactidis]
MITKPIEEMQGKYSISKCGKIINNKTKRVIKTHVNQRGYEAVTFTISKGVTRCFKVHRLVATAFIKKTCHSRVDVNHIDGNKLNNNAENLEWCTRKENMAHARRLGLIKPYYSRVSHDKSLSLLERNSKIKNDYMTGEFSQRELAKKYNLSKSQVGSILIDKRFI